MLTIRFQRVGRKNDPAYRIVLTEKRSRPKSSGHEILGSFHPKVGGVRLNRERISHWLSKGAKPSPRVHNILVIAGIIQGKKISVTARNVKPQNKVRPAEPAPLSQPVETATPTADSIGVAG